MSETITIKQGLDIKLLGGAHQEISHVDSGFYAIKPGDFIGVFPKLLVQEGDKVKAGTQLFYDKTWDFLRLTSPVSGIVKEIRRGAKRVLLEIIIEPGTVQEYEDFGKSDPNTLTKEQIIEKLVQSGVWPMLRQRPYNVVANPNDQPKAIFISAFDTSPLAPDYNFIVNGEAEAFQTGIDALAKLTSGKIHLNLKRSESISEFFTKTSKVQFNYFEGPHPAGNVGVQINKIDPINKGEVVIGVSDEPEAKVLALKEPKKEYYSAIDTKKRMSKTYEVSGIPHIVIIDPQGIVRWQGFPFLAGYELTDEVIDEILEKYSK
jgi:Na+-transporting NADH:ubiquinone oxidoreductase subunit A